MKKITKNQVELIEELVLAKAGIEKEIKIFDEINPQIQMKLSDVCSDIDELWKVLNMEVEEEKKDLKPDEKFDLTKDKKPEIKKTTQQDNIKQAEIIIVFEKELKTHLSEHPSINNMSYDVFFASLDLLKKGVGIDEYVGGPEDQDLSQIVDVVIEMDKVYTSAGLNYGDNPSNSKINHSANCKIETLNMEIASIFKRIDKIDYLNHLLDENKRIPF